MADEQASSPTRRGTEKRQRSKYVRVRCTPEEHAAIETAAARAGVSIGAFLRAQALGTPGPRSRRQPHVDRVELGRALGLLGLYGSNLNQLARAANIHGELPSSAELEQLGKEVRELRGYFMQALGYGR